MLTWVLEPDVQPCHAGLRNAALRSGQSVLDWVPEWETRASLPELESSAVLFHGSLSVADLVARRSDWSPGAFCRTEALVSSAWLKTLAGRTLTDRWLRLTVEALCADPVGALAELEHEGPVFVRPDSPLKPFSGRVLEPESISPAALDHGFYYEDLELPVIVTPAVEVGKEWRFVVADGHVVAGSGYEADGRTPKAGEPDGQVWRHAQDVVDGMVDAPELVFVLDLAETPSGLRVVELNPFSGADLFACDPDAVVTAIAGALGT